MFFRAEEITDEIVIEVAAIVRCIRGDAELARQMRNARLHYTYAYGSGRELRRQLRFAVAFGHVRPDSIEVVNDKLDHVLAILWKLIRRHEARGGCADSKRTVP